MRKSLVAVFLGFLLVGFGIWGTSGAATGFDSVLEGTAPQSGVSVTGHLLQEFPGVSRAVSGATVTLAGEGVSLSLTTPGTGRFEFTDVASGSYSLAVTSYPSDKMRAIGPISVPITVGSVAVTQNFHFYPTVVTVSVDPFLEVLHVSPDPLYIVPGQQVSWILDSPDPEPGPFTVHFNPLSPLMYRRKMAEVGDTMLDGQVRRMILPGKYSYFVAVEYRGKVYTEDPELIDENGDEQNPGDTTGSGGGVEIP